jgi:KipI family sensor histidine kinase inhibitor
MSGLAPFGDGAVRFSIDENAPRRRLLSSLRAIDGVWDVVMAEDIGCVVFDPAAERPAVEAEIARTLALAASASAGSDEEKGRTHRIRVAYDGEDLDEVARTLGRSREEVIALHTEPEYRVAMMGFLPGFAYLRTLHEDLRLARRAPRPRVPAGSVAVAATYTGIYPFASPGGWHLLGRAVGTSLFGANGAMLALGDVVRFVETREEPAAATATANASAERGRRGPPYLEVTRMTGFATLVDDGRRGHMHEGVPHGGPLVRSMLARANALAGNAAGECAVEVVGTLEVVARTRTPGAPLVVSDGSSRLVLADGDRATVSTVAPSGDRTRVAYLAVGGGIDAPLVLGGRGSLLVAGIGGFLRRGDAFRARSEPGSVERGVTGPSPSALLGPRRGAPDAPIAIAPGPDAGLSAEILSAPLRIAAASDRTGTRLEGWTPRAEAAAGGEMARRSTPMVTGAIELTPSGLIVLGPDHPTTGGYPVVAVVRSSSLDALFARPVGAPIRLVLG